jgi:serine/threonine-protein kinase
MAKIEGRLLGGRYRVGRLLGAGAMGRVHLATHVELARACAVKVIAAERASDADASPPVDVADAVARFRVEAMAASRLDHPNVLRVLDFGCEAEDGLWWLVTEHLEGEDLIDVMAADAWLSTPRITSIGRQLCAALQHAHDRGVVHRDVKPENIRLVRRPADDGRVVEVVKLVDFGTAAFDAGAPEADNGPRVVMGTPAYMSPEQATGRAVDGRSDLYSCGVLLFELATGRLPFLDATPFDLAVAHIECEPPAPRSIQPGVDPELEAVIQWCLRKNPAERPQSARALRDALGRVAARARERRRPAALADTTRMPSLPPPLSMTHGGASPRASMPSPSASLPPAARARRGGRVGSIAASVGLGSLAALVVCGAAWVVVGDEPPTEVAVRVAPAAVSRPPATPALDVPAGPAARVARQASPSPPAEHAAVAEGESAVRTSPAATPAPPAASPPAERGRAPGRHRASADATPDAAAHAAGNEVASAAARGATRGSRAGAATTHEAQEDDPYAGDAPTLAGSASAQPAAEPPADGPAKSPPSAPEPARPAPSLVGASEPPAAPSR